MGSKLFRVLSALWKETWLIRVTMPCNVSCPYFHFPLTGTVDVWRRILRSVAAAPSEGCGGCCGCSRLSCAVPRLPLSTPAPSPSLRQPRGDLANTLLAVQLFYFPRSWCQTGRKTNTIIKYFFASEPINIQRFFNGCKPYILVRRTLLLSI